MNPINYNKFGQNYSHHIYSSQQYILPYQQNNYLLQQYILPHRQMYLQNQYCYSSNFQQNLHSFNYNYCYNTSTVYPLMRISTNINLPINRFTLQNANNVSSNNSKLDQQKEVKNQNKNYMSILKNEKNEELYKCNLCEYKSIRKGSLKTHLILKHNIGDIKWYSCNHCNYKTKVKASLSKHEMLKHNTGNRPINWYHCKRSGCKFKAKQKCHIKEHERNVHDIGVNIKWYICKHQNCLYKTKHKGSFNRHLKNIHKIDLSQK